VDVTSTIFERTGMVRSREVPVGVREAS